jgi:hypothetical protein
MRLGVAALPHSSGSPCGEALRARPSLHPQDRQWKAPLRLDWKFLGHLFMRRFETLKGGKFIVDSEVLRLLLADTSPDDGAFALEAYEAWQRAVVRRQEGRRATRSAATNRLPTEAENDSK